MAEHDPPRRLAVVGERGALSNHPAGRGRTTRSPDDLDDVERELWRRIDRGARLRAAAPAAIPPDQLTAAAAVVTQAQVHRDRVYQRVRAIAVALAGPKGWLRLGHRVALLDQQRQQVFLLGCAERDQHAAETALTRLRHRAAARRHYLDDHATTLTDADRARADLDRRLDELVDYYLRLEEPPAWFALGIGTPPGPADFPAWVRQTRNLLERRRRAEVTHPLLPLG